MEKTIARKNLARIHLNGKDWDSDFVKNYHIWFNPGFILKDKRLKIPSLRAAMASGKIDNIISSLPDL